MAGAKRRQVLPTEVAFTITRAGQVIVPSEMRKEQRFNSNGVAILQSRGENPIGVASRDVSFHGIGIRIYAALESYRIGARLELEYAYPHVLHGLRIEVELKRVRAYDNGYTDCGFEIVSKNRMLHERLRGLIASQAARPA